MTPEQAAHAEACEQQHERARNVEALAEILYIATLLSAEPKGSAFSAQLRADVDRCVGTLAASLGLDVAQAVDLAGDMWTGRP